MRRYVWKNGLCALLCALLVLWAVPAGPAMAVGFFYDVPPTAWYASDVLTLVDKGVIQGTGQNQFSPNAPLSRGAFVTMICKTLLLPQEMQAYAFQGG